MHGLDERPLFSLSALILGFAVLQLEWKEGRSWSIKHKLSTKKTRPSTAIEIDGWMLVEWSVFEGQQDQTDVVAFGAYAGPADFDGGRPWSPLYTNTTSKLCLRTAQIISGCRTSCRPRRIWFFKLKMKIAVKEPLDEPKLVIAASGKTSWTILSQQWRALTSRRHLKLRELNLVEDVLQVRCPKMCRKLYFEGHCLFIEEQN